jgi:hypothetical protein
VLPACCVDDVGTVGAESSVDEIEATGDCGLPVLGEFDVSPGPRAQTNPGEKCHVT